MCRGGLATCGRGRLRPPGKAHYVRPPRPLPRRWRWRSIPGLPDQPVQLAWREGGCALGALENSAPGKCLCGASSAAALALHASRSIWPRARTGRAGRLVDAGAAAAAAAAHVRPWSCPLLGAQLGCWVLRWDACGGVGGGRRGKKSAGGGAAGAISAQTTSPQRQRVPLLSCGTHPHERLAEVKSGGCARAPAPRCGCQQDPHQLSQSKEASSSTSKHRPPRRRAAQPVVGAARVPAVPPT